MFIRSVKATSSSGTVHEYVRIVSTVREKGRVKQKVIANLGRRDTLEAVLPLLNRFFKGEQELAGQLAQEGPIEVLDASTWGPMLAVRALFRELGLWTILDECDADRPPHLRASDKENHDWISRVPVLVANRLTRPASEHGLAAWLETDFVCDRMGRRYLPCWKQQRRVKVDFAQLQRWYRTLDHLIAHKERIEVALYHRLRDLFSLEPELVFYDLTSTYFEGHGPPGFAKHGYSRDGKPRNVQVVVGVVMVAGWPIAHHVWAGNTRDSSTVTQVLDDLSGRFRFQRVVFVGDRGMVSQTNFKTLKHEQKDRDFGFLWGMVRRRNPEVEQLIDRTQDDRWIQCPTGINAREKQPSPKTRVQEVPCDRQGVRVFVVDSDERRQYEQRMREKAMTRVREGLEKVRARVAAGRLKAPTKIGAAVGRALQRNHGYRYYAWELKDGQLTFFDHPVNLPREKKYEGKYLIQTDQSDITPIEAVGQYKQLNDVERGFRSLKDPISMRPIHHRTEDRVRAHVFVAALAFLLERLLDQHLKAAGTELSPADALSALATIRHVTFRVQDEQRTGVTPGSSRARQVLKALKLTHLRPPAPPTGDQTTM
jgi:transposase